MFAALSACQALHPDPEDSDDSESMAIGGGDDDDVNEEGLNAHGQV